MSATSRRSAQRWRHHVRACSPPPVRRLSRAPDRRHGTTSAKHSAEFARTCVASRAGVDEGSGNPAGQGGANSGGCKGASLARVPRPRAEAEGAAAWWQPPLAPSTLYRAPVGQGPSGPDWLATCPWVLVWTGACYWHGVGGFMFKSSSLPGGRTPGDARGQCRKRLAISTRTTRTTPRKPG